MTLPVSKYEELLETVRNLKHQTIKVREFVNSWTCDQKQNVVASISMSSSSSLNDASSVRSFGSSCGAAQLSQLSVGTVVGVAGTAGQSRLDAKAELVHGLLGALSDDEKPDVTQTLLALSQTKEGGEVVRRAGCLQALVELVHDGVNDTKARHAIRNLVEAQTDDKLRKRELRVLTLLEDCWQYIHCLKQLPDSQSSESGNQETKHPIVSLEQLIKLSFDETYRGVIHELGGIQTLATLLLTEVKYHNIIKNENASLPLFQLKQNEIKAPNEDETEIEASEQQPVECTTLLRYVTMALTNLTFGHGGSKALLCSRPQFLASAAPLLQLRPLAQTTAAVLRNLSWRADHATRVALREAGITQRLVQAAMTATDVSCLKVVLSALWNLSAHSSENKLDFCSIPGALPFLVDLLQSNNLQIVENAGGILRNLSCLIAIRDDFRAEIRTKNILNILLNQLQSVSLTIVANACGTLWNLSAKNATDQKILCELGAVQMLRSLNNSKHNLIASGSRAALKNLLSASKQAQTQSQPQITAKKRDYGHQHHHHVASATTNTDTTVDYALRYAEIEKSEIEKSSGTSQPTELTTNSEDTIRTYCTEGTPGVFSAATSCGDLRNVGVVEKELPVAYCEEGTPRTCTPPPQPPFQPTATKEETTLVFHPKEETPLMFSRSSSLSSLSSADQPIPDEDDASVISDLSRLTSGIISPSELPDSPTGNIVLNRNRIKTQPDEQKSKEVVASAPLPKAQQSDLEGSSEEEDEMLAACIDLGRRENCRRKPTIGVSAAEDELKRYGIEDSPGVFSLRSSLSDLSEIVNELEDGASCRRREFGSKTSSYSSNNRTTNVAPKDFAFVKRSLDLPTHKNEFDMQNFTSVKTSNLTPIKKESGDFASSRKSHDLNVNKKESPNEILNENMLDVSRISNLASVRKELDISYNKNKSKTNIDSSKTEEFLSVKHKTDFDKSKKDSEESMSLNYHRNRREKNVDFSYQVEDGKKTRRHWKYNVSSGECSPINYNKKCFYHLSKNDVKNKKSEKVEEFYNKNEEFSSLTYYKNEVHKSRKSYDVKNDDFSSLNYKLNCGEKHKSKDYMKHKKDSDSLTFNFCKKSHSGEFTKNAKNEFSSLTFTKKSSSDFAFNEFSSLTLNENIPKKSLDEENVCYAKSSQELISETCRNFVKTDENSAKEIEAAEAVNVSLEETLEVGLSSLSSLSDAETEEALLAQCIQSAKPKNPLGVPAALAASQAQQPEPSKDAAADASDSRMFDPDAMLASLDRFTINLVAQATWLPHQQQDNDFVMKSSTNEHPFIDSIDVSPPETKTSLQLDEFTQFNKDNEKSVDLTDGLFDKIKQTVGFQQQKESSLKSDNSSVKPSLKLEESTEEKHCNTWTDETGSVCAFSSIELPSSVGKSETNEEQPIKQKKIFLPSCLENVQPPSLFNDTILDLIDMENSMINVSSITSEVAPDMELSANNNNSNVSDSMFLINSISSTSSNNSPLTKRKVTPKQRRQMCKDRFKTYTIVSEQQQQHEEQLMFHKQLAEQAEQNSLLDHETLSLISNDDDDENEFGFDEELLEHQKLQLISSSNTIKQVKPQKIIEEIKINEIVESHIVEVQHLRETEVNNIESVGKFNTYRKQKSCSNQQLLPVVNDEIKPKIVKPVEKTNEAENEDEENVKAVRGRRKPLYKKNTTFTKSNSTTTAFIKPLNSTTAGTTFNKFSSFATTSKKSVTTVDKSSPGYVRSKSSTSSPTRTSSTTATTFNKSKSSTFSLTTFGNRPKSSPPTRTASSSPPTRASSASSFTRTSSTKFTTTRTSQSTTKIAVPFSRSKSSTSSPTRTLSSTTSKTTKTTSVSSKPTTSTTFTTRSKSSTKIATSASSTMLNNKSKSSTSSPTRISSLRNRSSSSSTSSSTTALKKRPDAQKSLIRQNTFTKEEKKSRIPMRSFTHSKIEKKIAV